MTLGRFNSNPTHAHLLAAKGVLRYLLGTLDFALEYNFEQVPIGNPTSLIFPTDCGFSDADWASDEFSRRSVSGFAFFLYGCLVSWSALSQRTIALSSTEAEYMALAHALKDGIWIRLFLIILGLPFPSPFPLLCDNQSALNIANSEAVHSRSKHIDVRHHFIKQVIASGAFCNFLGFHTRYGCRYFHEASLACLAQETLYVTWSCSCALNSFISYSTLSLSLNVFLHSDGGVLDHTSFLSCHRLHTHHVSLLYIQFFGTLHLQSFPHSPNTEDVRILYI